MVHSSRMRRIVSTREVNGTRSVPTPLLRIGIFLWLVAASQACLAGEAVSLQIDRLMVPLSSVDRLPTGAKHKSSHGNQFRLQAVDFRVELDHPFDLQFRFRDLVIDLSGSVSNSKSTRNAFDVQIRYESWTENSGTPFHICLRFDRMSITADGVLGAESKPGKVDHRFRFSRIVQSTSSLPLDDSLELSSHSSTTASGGGAYKLGKDVPLLTGSTGRVVKQKDGTDLLLNTTFKAFVRIDRIPSK